MLGGSEVVNAKAADAWFTVDLRSTDNEVVADLEKKIAAILEEEARRADMTVKTEVISTSKAAVIPGHRESHLVKVAEAVHRAMGFNPPITNTGSNNSSAALLAGISSISTGAGPCSDSHALTENCEIEPLYKGIKKILLLAVALAGIE
jgi:acetylornithine deacetylase/succinyl-diaminopimelate desuccinylase-like protein